MPYLLHRERSHNLKPQMSRNFVSIKKAAKAVACKGWDIQPAGRGQWSLAIEGEAIGIGTSAKVLAMVNKYWKDSSFKPTPITFTNDELDTLLTELEDQASLMAWEQGDRERFLALHSLTSKIRKAHGLEVYPLTEEEQKRLDDPEQWAA